MSKKAKSRDGNGSAIDINSGVYVDGFLLVDDLVPASVLVMYFLQKLGNATADQIGEKMEAKQARVNANFLKQTLEALRARGLASYATVSLASGESVQSYKPRNVKWANAPEVAQITQHFLSELVATPEARELLVTMNLAEHEGDGKAKAKEKMKYADYHEIEATFVTTGPFFGGQPDDSQDMQRLVKKGPACPENADLRFPRAEDGWPVIPMSNLRGWIRNGLRESNYGDSIADYKSFQEVRIDFEPPIRQAALPVIDDRGKGVGLNTYEVIPAGARFTLRLAIPTRGFMSPEQFKVFLMKIGLQCQRGLSNGRSGTAGRCAMVAFKDLGPSHSAEVVLRNLLGSELPKEAKDFYGTTLEEVTKSGGLSLLAGQGKGN